MCASGEFCCGARGRWGHGGLRPTLVKLVCRVYATRVRPERWDEGQPSRQRHKFACDASMASLEVGWSVMEIAPLEVSEQMVQAYRVPTCRRREPNDIVRTPAPTWSQAEATDGMPLGGLQRGPKWALVNRRTSMLQHYSHSCPPQFLPHEAGKGL